MLMKSDLPTVVEWCNKIRGSNPTENDLRDCLVAAFLNVHPFYKNLTEIELEREYRRIDDGTSIYGRFGQTLKPKGDDQTYFIWFDGLIMMIRCFNHLATQVGNQVNLIEALRPFGVRDEKGSTKCQRYQRYVAQKKFDIMCNGWQYVRTGLNEANVTTIRASWKTKKKDQLERLIKEHGSLEAHLEIEHLKLATEELIEGRWEEWEKFRAGRLPLLEDEEFQLVCEWTDYEPIEWLPYINEKIGPTDEAVIFASVDWEALKDYPRKVNKSMAHLVPEKYRALCVRSD